MAKTMNINFNYLECFLTLAQNLSFSQTAQVLKIAQPAVSRQIKLLEAQLGSQLFLRDRHSVVLTQTGTELFKELAPLYAAMLERLSDQQTEQGKVKGPIRVGLLAEAGEKIFVPLISEFKHQYPDVKFHIKLLKGHEIVELIKLGQLDFGLVSESIDQENIRCYKILKEESTLYTRSANKIAASKLEEIAKLPFITYRESDPLLQAYLKRFYPRTSMAKLQQELVVNSHKAMISMLLEHDLFAVLPKLSVEQELKQGKLKAVSTKKLESWLYFIYFENNLLELRKKVFKEFLLAQFK